ncbi:hypothetical protein U1Q18_030420 [Sarracenia purpurea var. burkii]
MAELSEEDIIVEEREELMVSTKNAPPASRIAHFLNPSASSTDRAAFNFPSHSLSSATLKKPPLKVAFNGWIHPPNSWGNWVDHMQKWSPETRTFLFPFGEATITLEDMIVLGGYPVLGDSVLSPLDKGDLRKTREKLLESRLEIVRSRAQKASQSTWIKKFMHSGSEIEHEAFLSLWLSIFVFPASSFKTIGKHVFSMAVLLARGAKLALAPSVLAVIYRDLSLLRDRIMASNKFEAEEWEENVSRLTVWAPFQLVQVWIWERFPTLWPNLRPNNRNSTREDEQRFARWQTAKKPNTGNLALGIALEGKSFQWRPFDLAGPNILFQKLWNEKEEWVPVSSPRLDDELECFARCLRVSELVGPDCIELYLPNRVARQFGFDQDVPGIVARYNTTPRIAWESYTRPVRDAKLYIPPRLFEPSVTTRYSEWWQQLNNDRLDSVKKENNSEKAGGYKSPVHLEHSPKSTGERYLDWWKGLNNARFDPFTGDVKKENDSGKTGGYKFPEHDPKFTGKVTDKNPESAISPDKTSKSIGKMTDMDSLSTVPPRFPSKYTGKMARKGPFSAIPHGSSSKCNSKKARGDTPAPPGFSPEFIKVKDKDFVEKNTPKLTELFMKMEGRGRQVQDHRPPSLDSDNGSLQSVEMTMNPEKKIGGND